MMRTPEGPCSARPETRVVQDSLDVVTRRNMPVANGMPASKSYDVIVVGLGGMGSAITYELARRGVRVIGLDRFYPPHNQGSSHGQSRIIRQAIFEDPAYVPLVLRSYEKWRELEAASDRQLLTSTSCLIIGRRDSSGVTGMINSAALHGISVDVLEPDDVTRDHPVFVLEDDEVAVREQNAGVLFPEECVQAQLEQAMRHGADLRMGEAVVSWEETAGYVAVRTEKGDVFTGERLVISAGAWNIAMFGHPFPLTVTRQVIAWFDPEARELATAERLPPFAWDYTPEKALYGLPGVRGEGVKLGFHHGGDDATPETIDRRVNESELKELQALLARRMPRLGTRVTSSQVCMYTNTPDQHFIVGPHPAASRVVLAGGFSGHGFKFCPIIGEIAADLATNGATDHPIDLFSPQRFVDRRGD